MYTSTDEAFSRFLNFLDVVEKVENENIACPKIFCTNLKMIKNEMHANC